MKILNRKRGYVLAYAAVCTSLILVLLGIQLTAVSAQNRIARQTEDEIDNMIAAYAVGEAFCANPECAVSELEARGGGLVSVAVETLSEPSKTLRLTVKSGERVLLCAEAERVSSGYRIRRYEVNR